jgi:thioredoxin-like negative regulator of GroEL
VDIEQEPGLAAKYDVPSVPHLALFSGQAKVSEKNGAVDFNQIMDMLDEALA